MTAFTNKAFCYYPNRSVSTTYFMDILPAAGNEMCQIRTIHKVYPGGKSGPASVNLYPNPANSTINLVAGSDYTGLTQVTLFDLAGKRIQCFEFEKTQAVQTVSINLENVKPGVYFVETRFGTSDRLVKKILVY